MSISPTIKIQNMTTRHEIHGLGAVSVVHKKINHLGDQHTKTRYAQAGKMVQITEAVQAKKMEDQSEKITAIAKEIVRSDDKEERRTLRGALMVQARILAKLEMGAMTITDKLEERALEISTKAYDKEAAAYDEEVAAYDEEVAAAAAHAKKMADQTKTI